MTGRRSIEAYEDPGHELGLGEIFGGVLADLHQRDDWVQGFLRRHFPIVGFLECDLGVGILRSITRAVCWICFELFSGKEKRKRMGFVIVHQRHLPGQHGAAQTMLI